MTAARFGWPAALLAASAAVQLTWSLDLDFALRPLLVAAFLLVCPGMALVRLVRVGDPWAQLALAIGLSIALSTAVPAVLIYADDDLNANASLFALTSSTAIAVLADLLRDRREHPR